VKQGFFACSSVTSHIELTRYSYNPRGQGHGVPSVDPPDGDPAGFGVRGDMLLHQLVHGKLICEVDHLGAYFRPDVCDAGAVSRRYTGRLPDR